MNNQPRQFKADFVGIGAPKSATSWIYQCLKEHPQICVSAVKETDFFVREEKYSQGIDYYQSYFNHCSDNNIKGEFCADYLAEANAAGLIKKHFPDTKIIACLRNPIERAYSHYYFDVARGKRSRSFEKSLKTNYDYIGQGFYHRHLKNYFNLFPRRNILVLIYEDIDKNPPEFIRGVYSFLGVSPDFVPKSADRKINLTSRNKLYLSWFNELNFRKTADSFKKRYWGRQFIKFLKATNLSSAILFLKRKNLKGELDDSQKPLARQPMNPETRRYLQKTYQEDIKNTEQLINRKLSFWN